MPGEGDKMVTTKLKGRQLHGGNTKKSAVLPIHYGKWTSKLFRSSSPPYTEIKLILQKLT